MDVFSIFSLLGGLALFLFGMDIMGKSLEKQAGGKLKNILEKLSNNPIKGFLLGLTVTAIIQSSSATTVMVVGFVNSGIMNLSQAIGVIMGSNVGTTATAWLLSLTGIEGENFFVQMLEPSTFAPILAVIGILMYMGSKKTKKQNIGTILLGFAILMSGMQTMSAAVKPLAGVPEFTALFTIFENPILGLLIGAVLTAILQSSSASVGILQALAVTGAISYASAIPIILGQNIGTCVTALISSIGANKNAKRAAVVHLYFNLIGSTLFLVVFYIITSMFEISAISQGVTPLGIAIVHTVFNVLATLILLPFTKVLAKIATATIRDNKEEIAKGEKFQILDERLLVTPFVAVERSKQLVYKMLDEAQHAVALSITLIDQWDEKVSENVIKIEKDVDEYEDKLGSYLMKLSVEDLDVENSYEVSRILHVIGDIERISDHALNIRNVCKEMLDKNTTFTTEALKGINVLNSAVLDIIDVTFKSYNINDEKIAFEVEPFAKVIYELIREVKSQHIDRLKAGTCTIEMGFVLMDLLAAYKRLADRCSNIALSTIELGHGQMEAHGYILNLDKDENSLYNKYLNMQRKKYTLY